MKMAVGEKSTRPNRLIPRNPLKDEDFFSEKLRDSERDNNLIRPLWNVYKHLVCGQLTKIETDLAILLAKRPRKFAGLRCCHCGFRPIQEFVWDASNDPCGL